MSDTITIGSSGRIAIALIGVALLAGLAGCAGEPHPTTDKSPSVTGDGTVVYENGDEDVVRFVDREAGTVCYYFSSVDVDAGQGGLSCVPIDQTALGDA
jgi:hypothetical protein